MRLTPIFVYIFAFIEHQATETPSVTPTATSPPSFSLTKVESIAEDESVGEETHGFSAADYDPTKDRIADDERQLHHKSAKDLELLKAKDLQEAVIQQGDDDSDMFAADYKETLTERNGNQESNTEKVQNGEELDMFADEDMFAHSPESKENNTQLAQVCSYKFDLRSMDIQ